VADAVRDQRGQVLGIAAVAYGLDAVVAFTERLASAQEVQLTVTDATGHVLSGRRTSSSVLTRTPHDLVSAALRGGSDTAHYDLGDGQVLAAYGPVERLGWSVVAEVPEDAALHAVGTLTARVVVATVLILQLLLLGLVLAVRADSRRRVLESELADREEHLRSALEAAGDAYVAIDAQTGSRPGTRGPPRSSGTRRRRRSGACWPTWSSPRSTGRRTWPGCPGCSRAAWARARPPGRARGAARRRPRLPGRAHAVGQRTAEQPSYHGFVRDLTSLRAQAVELAAAHAARWRAPGSSRSSWRT
jgi:PAS domain-containing protein